MKKIKVNRNSTITILNKKRSLLDNFQAEKINYLKWVEFIENHRDYFIWYEDTNDGKDVLHNINKVPEWAKEGVIYGLNKKIVYSTNKIVKNHFDLIIKYIENEGIIKVDIEKKMSQKVGEIILKMSNYLEGKLIIDDSKELEKIEQLD